jgi:hypothetical protein
VVDLSPVEHLIKIASNALELIDHVKSVLNLFNQLGNGSGVEDDIANPKYGLGPIREKQS